MQALQTAGNPRIDIVLSLVKDLSHAQDPQEVLRIFSDGMNRLFAPRAYLSLSTRGLRPGQFKITRFIEDDTAVRLDGHDPWSLWSQLPVLEGGVLGDIVRAGLPVILHEMSAAGDAAVGDRLSGYRSLMAVPLFDGGQALNWAVFLKRDPRGFDLNELEETILRANLVGGTVRNVLITKQLREANQKIQQEVEQIAKIQRALLPPHLPSVPGLVMAAQFHTYDQAGGDIYDVSPLRNSALVPEPVSAETAWAILIADASGHGPAATTVTAMLHAILHAYPRMPRGPAELMEHANRHLCAKRIEASFITAFLGFYDPTRRTLTYARAGHPPPLLKDPGPHGHVHRLDAVGTYPLGVLPEAAFDEATVQLQNGQMLLLYTDGIVESQNPQGDMFGIEGVERALAQCIGDPHCTVDTLTRLLREHEAGWQPNDDQTFLAVQVMRK